MSPLSTPRRVESLVGRLRVVREDLTRLDHRLRAASWQDYELEDLELAGMQLRQVQERLVRHAHRWRARQRTHNQ